MNQQINKSISKYKKYIINMIEEEMYEACACLGNYVDRFCDENVDFRNLYAGGARHLINNYFKNLVENIQDDLSDYLNRLNDQIQEHSNQPDFKFEIIRAFSQKNIADFVEYQLRNEMQKGIMRFNDNFTSDFKNNLLYSAPHQNQEFEIKLRSLNNKMQIRIETLMKESRDKISRAAVSQMDILKDSYIQLASTDKEELKKQQEIEKITHIKDRLSNIYNSYSEAIENDSDVKQNYKNIVDATVMYLKESSVLDEMQPEQYEKFKELFNIFTDSMIEFYKKKDFNNKIENNIDRENKSNNAKETSNIDKYISASQSMDATAGGTNKKCYTFDDVVLLEGAFGDEELQRKEKIDILKNNGVNVCRILEYASIDNKKYELQEKAKGEELFQFKFWHTPEGQQKYLKVLDSLSNQDISFYEKFLTDWNKILNTGLSVDPSKSTNFFYDGENISFIDLNISSNQEKERDWMLKHAAVVLRGGGLLWQCKDVYEEANEKVKIIYQQLGEAGIKMGENIDEYISYLDPNGDYGLNDYFNSYQKGSTRK